VKFKHPDYDGGVPVLFYLLQYKLSLDTSWVLAANSTERKIRVSNLLVSREYMFRVCACNIVGKEQTNKQSKAKNVNKMK
jgi:hypothetical protein